LGYCIAGVPNVVSSQPDLSETDRFSFMRATSVEIFCAKNNKKRSVFCPIRSKKPLVLHFLTKCFASIRRLDTFVRRLTEVPTGLTSLSIACERYRPPQNAHSKRESNLIRSRSQN